MLKHLAFGFLISVSLLIIHTTCSDEEIEEFDESQQDSLLIPNEIIWIGPIRPRRESSEVRREIKNPNSVYSQIRPQLIQPRGSGTSHHRTSDQLQLPTNSDLYYALKKKRYSKLGVEVHDFLHKNAENGQALDEDGQPREGVFKNKMTGNG